MQARLYSRHTRPQHQGYLDDWLVVGPRTRAVDVCRLADTDFPAAVVQAYRHQDHGLQDPPLEFTSPFADLPHLRWTVIHCQEDHFVYGSAFHPTPHYVEYWAYTAIELGRDWRGQAALTTNGPADIWLDNVHVHRSHHFAPQRPRTVAFALNLTAGRHYVLVRFACVGIRACPMVMALQLQDCPDLEWLLPTAPQWEETRPQLDHAFRQAFLRQDIFERQSDIYVHWPDGDPLDTNITLRLERQDGRIYSEQRTEGRQLVAARLGTTYQFPAGEYWIRLLPELLEFYRHGRRMERRLPVYLTGNIAYSQERYGTYTQRRQEALLHAAQQEGSIFHEIAKMELNYWQDVDWTPFHTTVDMVESRADCSDFYLIGLLGALMRYGEHVAFPDDLRDRLRSCILAFRYWMDEPGQDTMCFWTENHQILFHGCEMLAGQLYPDTTFTNNGMTGAQHQALGEQRVLTWLRQRARGGFREWDSNTYFEEDVLALSHILDLTLNDEVYEMAVVVLDKLFFSLAVNSFRGVFGSTHGRSYAPMLKGSLREATSGLTRLLWGMGIFNNHVLGTVSLACAAGYRLAPVIEAIALDPAPEIWSREQHAGTLDPQYDRETGDWCVNKVTYKTPDYMLASAQDYNPGQPGQQQHVWQATLGPAAVSFVTHPPCLSEDSSHRPNAWHGNVRLPRVAQYHDVLIALYDLGPDDWMGFTHAYFPTYAFDTYYLQSGWAFAKVGAGYLALTASTTLHMTAEGPNAYRELRAYGARTAWIVQMGRQDLDGDFKTFRDRVRQLPRTFTDLQVTFESLRGDTYMFDMQEPFRRNGEEVPLAGFPHYDNPYTQTSLDATAMDIQFQDLLLRLHFD